MFNTFDEINDKTGFANGERFNSELDVLDYFSEENMIDMFGENNFDQTTLYDYATAVIQNRWHCNFD